MRIFSQVKKRFETENIQKARLKIIDTTRRWL